MLGIIGTGAMGTAIIRGAITSGRMEASEICAYDKSRERTEALRDEYGIGICNSLHELAEKSKILLLAVKPNVYESVLTELRQCDPDPLFVTIAVGYSMDLVKKHLQNENARIIRTMPNTPCQIGQGVIGMCHTETVQLTEMERVKYIFEGFSTVVEIDESMMHVFAAVSGSMPAFVDLFIEAAADAAVMEGMTRADAYRVIAGAVAGSAKLVAETKEHPGKLKDAVTSPGGTTIQGVYELESGAFRATVMNAILATTAKSREME